jgi:DNA-binding LytR/AlgR family response regulator
MKSVDKVYHLLEKESAGNTNEYLFVKSGKQLKKIFIEDILFVESMENYVNVFTASSKEVVYSTLKLFLESLPGDRFLRVHRSYVVNLKHIHSIEGNMLHIASHEIPVARNLRDQVFNTILSNRLIAKI